MNKVRRSAVINISEYSDNFVRDVQIIRALCEAYTAMRNGTIKRKHSWEIFRELLHNVNKIRFEISFYFIQEVIKQSGGSIV